LPPSSHYQQIVEFPQEGFGCPLLVTQLLPLRPANLSLNTTLVTAVEQFLHASTQVQVMKTIRGTLAESGLAAWLTKSRSDLCVLPPARVHLLPHVEQQAVQLAWVVYERVAIIGEWQRYESWSSQPSLDSAENKPIR
jgi:hypothetical protein